jgi:hypothetical protein
MHTQFLLGSAIGKSTLGDIGADRRAILNICQRNMTNDYIKSRFNSGDVRWRSVQNLVSPRLLY